MAKLQPIQYAFNGGEFGSDLFGRPDFPRFQQAVASLEGFIPKPQGGVKRRGGFLYSADAFSQTNKSFLVPFTFKNTQAYVLEFSELKMRVFRNNFLVAGGFGADLISNGDFASDIVGWTVYFDPSGWAYWWNSRLRTDSTIFGGAPDAGGAWQAVTVTPGSEYQFDWDHYTSSFWSGTKGKVMIGTTVRGSDLFSKEYTSGDDLGEFARVTVPAGITSIYITFESRNFGSTGRSDSWDNVQCREVTSAGFELTTPFSADDLFQIKFAQTFDAMYIAHPSYHPQKLLRLGHDNWTIGNVSFVGSPTGFAGGAGEYPAAVGFHGVRLVWAGTDDNPLDIWGSKGDGLIESMALGTAADDDAFNLEVFSDSGESIQWLKSLQNVLVASTSETEHAGITPNNAPVTPGNFFFSPGSNEGGANINPLRASGSVIFAIDGGKILYRLDTDGLGKFATTELTIVNPEITDGGIVQLAWMKRPNKIVWAITTNGDLISLTFNKEHDVFAWARQPVDGQVESLVVIKAPSGLEDQLWISVVRLNVSGVEERRIEYMDPEVYADGGLRYSGTPTHTFSGADHLEGETVQVVGDGKVFEPAVVTGGVVQIEPDLPEPQRTKVSEAYIGFNYTSKLITLPMDILGQGFNTVGFFKQWVALIVRFKDTIGGMVNGQDVNFRTEGDLPGAILPPFSGTYKIEGMSDWDREAQITIEQPHPLPMEISSIAGLLEVSEP